MNVRTHIRSGDIDVVKQYLSKIHFDTLKDGGGGTLRAAIYFKNLDVVNLLI